MILDGPQIYLNSRYRQTNLPNGLKELNACAAEQTTLLHKPFEKVLVENMARVLSDLEAIRRLVTSKVGRLIVREPDHFSDWAVKFSSLVFNAMQPLPNQELEAKMYAEETVISNYLIDYHSIKEIKSLLSQLKEPDEDSAGVHCLLQALLMSIERRSSIYLQSYEHYYVARMDMHIILKEEVQRLNAIIPETIGEDLFSSFVASRVYEDLTFLRQLCQYYNCELMYSVLCNDQEEYFHNALTKCGLPKHCREHILMDVDDFIE